MTTFLIIALLAYNAWLAYHLLSRPSAAKGQTASREEKEKERKVQDEAADIVGKSRFKMETPAPAQQERTTPLAATMAPQAATQEKTEAVDIENTTFADETDEKPFRQVPTDRLDETFTDIRINDVTGENEDAEDGETDTPTARGTSFEDIDRAVKSVRKSEADEEEKLHAGRTFKDIAETELFQKITESFTGISDRVNEAIDLYTARAMQAKPLVLPERIEDFDIRDFV
ncbi:hypothetical protein [Prevotella intermedia]|uniref:Conjugal transfer protein TraD n=1 Tax=Prevotella intermedia TaxID=28131 RepID=A0A2D3NA82_PREIN|nr:hypothetical protein [Prevotella intermedia]ATV51896.1 hypothetical protein CTM50_01700 [Prevotella intermedia]